MTQETAITSLWVESLQAAFSLARGERIAEFGLCECGCGRTI